MRKKHCAWCGTTRFGMIRHWHWTLQFCSLRCKLAHLDAQFKKTLEMKRWLAWLRT